MTTQGFNRIIYIVTIVPSGEAVSSLDRKAAVRQCWRKILKFATSFALLLFLLLAMECNEQTWFKQYCIHECPLGKGVREKNVQ